MKPFLQIKPLGRRNKKGARSKFSLGKEVKKEQMRSTLINQRWSVELPGDGTRPVPAPGVARDAAYEAASWTDLLRFVQRGTLSWQPMVRSGSRLAQHRQTALDGLLG
uniref:(northern house mosquito) hypothetical protein n=1 Tax=Culex pipiens TaxID=7175 RepID=A0A8D7ZUS7_CULPI